MMCSVVLVALYSLPACGCVVCVVLWGQVEHSWLASCSYGSTHLQHMTIRPSDHVMVSMTLVDLPSTVSGVWLHALDGVLLVI